MSSNRDKIREANQKRIQERLDRLTNENNSEPNPIDDFIDNSNNVSEVVNTSVDNTSDIKKIQSDNIDSVKQRFGISAEERPLRNSQASFRIPQELHDNFREVVKALYYPKKPNYNQIMIEIMESFVEEFQKTKK